jgi:hypothetical protein
MGPMDLVLLRLFPLAPRQRLSRFLESKRQLRKI